jgi:hypothetical protein
MADKQNPKWKDNLLKSSLPLEQIVWEKIEAHDFTVFGEFAYNRPNEQGVDTEFSVDLHAVDYVEYRKESRGFINLLLECKYNHPGIKWIFTPYPRKSTVIGSDIITVLQDLCTQRITNSKFISNFGNELEYCTKGVEIYDNGMDLNSITRGLYQLRFAIPSLVALECMMQLETWHQEDLHISFICPILVTTANLFVLKPGIDIRAFQEASSLTDIADEVNYLVVHQGIGPQLDAHCSKIVTSFHKRFTGVKARIEALSTVLHDDKISKGLPVTWIFDDHFRAATENILVVKLDALDQVLVDIRSSITKAGRYVKREAQLVADLEKRITQIVPLQTQYSTARRRR